MIVYGQTNLLKAAQEAGVKKFIPSTFSLNMFNIPEGEHPFLDSRVKFAKILEKSGMPHVHILNGGWLSAVRRCCHPGGSAISGDEVRCTCMHNCCPALTPAVFM